MYLADFSDKKNVFAEFSSNYELRFGKFAASGLEDILKDWYENSKILFAWYGRGEYDGSAFVLLERSGELYEVNGGHCSCYGLEGQFDPEKTSVKELKHRLIHGTLGHSDYYTEGNFNKKLLDLLNRWQRKRKQKE